MRVTPAIMEIVFPWRTHTAAIATTDSTDPIAKSTSTNVGETHATMGVASIPMVLTGVCATKAMLVRTVRTCSTLAIPVLVKMVAAARTWTTSNTNVAVQLALSENAVRSILTIAQEISAKTEEGASMVLELTRVNAHRNTRGNIALKTSMNVPSIQIFARMAPHVPTLIMVTPVSVSMVTKVEIARSTWTIALSSLA